MKYLSWDCANRTLAWTLCEINDISVELNELIGAWEVAAQNITDLNITDLNNTNLTPLIDLTNDTIEVLSNYMKSESHGVIDILGGKKVRDCTDVERCVMLYKFLESSPVSVEKLFAGNLQNTNLTILIEHQPPKLGKSMQATSPAISHQLLMYYLRITPNIHFINPKLKNKIVFSVDTVMSDIVLQYDGKYATRPAQMYHAGKEHSIRCMRVLEKYWLGGFSAGVKKACLDDLADSLLQVFAFKIFV